MVQCIRIIPSAADDRRPPSLPPRGPARFGASSSPSPPAHAFAKGKRLPTGHQCRNPALLGELHCVDHASADELARRKSLGAVDDAKLWTPAPSPREEKLSSAPPPPPPPSSRSSSSSSSSSCSSSALAKRIKLLPPRAASPPSPTDAASPGSLPAELADLVLEHLDAQDLDRARRDPTCLSPDIGRALHRLLDACTVPGACVRTYRALFTDHYGEALRDELAAVDKRREKKNDGDSGGGGGSGDETKRERVSPLASAILAESLADGAESRDAKMTAVASRRPHKCATACLTDTQAIETLLKDYTVAYATRGGSPWQEFRGTLFEFAQAATESVSGDPVAVRVALSYVSQYGVGRGADAVENQWKLTVTVRMPPHVLPAYVASDRDSATWTDYLHTRAGAPNRSTDPAMRALGRFMRDILARAASSARELAPQECETEGDEGVSLRCRPWGCCTDSTSPGEYAFYAPPGHVVSDDATRVFARIVRAVSAAFASIATLEPEENYRLGAGHTEAAYVSPVPAHILRVRRAFPTLPIRVLYRRTGEGLVFLPRPPRGNPISWPTLSILEAVQIANAEGAGDVVAVRLVEQ